MTADGKLPPAERRGYKNVFNALVRIVKEEGVGTLWKVNTFLIEMCRFLLNLIDCLQIGSYTNRSTSYGSERSSVGFLFAIKRSAHGQIQHERGHIPSFRGLDDIWSHHYDRLHARRHCQNSSAKIKWIN